MTEYFSGNKFTLTLRALNPKVTCHVKILGMVCHQPWLNEFLTNRTFHLAAGVLIQAQTQSSTRPALLGLDWRDVGRWH